MLQVITSEDGVDIAFHDGTATLTVEQATQEDSGCYKCIASNKAGKAVSQCTVIVKERESGAEARSGRIVTHCNDRCRTPFGC